MTLTHPIEIVAVVCSLSLINQNPIIGNILLLLIYLSFTHINNFGYMSTVTTTIATYSGVNFDFQSYCSLYLDAAAGSTMDEHGQGLLGFVLTPAEFLALPFQLNLPAPVAFAALDNPGPQPVLANGANALQVSVHNAAWHTWKSDHERAQQQQRDILAFKSSFIASLDNVSDKALRHPTTGFRQVTCAAIHAYLLATFGTLSAADLTKNADLLRIPYQASTPIRDYTANHRKAHATALANNQPFPESQKVQHLLVGLRPCGLFTACLQIWLSGHATVAAQTFDLLADAVHLAAENVDPTATSGTMGYTAAAVAAPLGLSDKDLARIIAAIKATTTPVTATKAAVTGPLPVHYCWTHGPGHSGHKCRNPAVGHMKAATAANKMGGQA